MEWKQQTDETEKTKAHAELQEAKNALAQAQITMKAAEKANEAAEKAKAEQLCCFEIEIMREIAVQPGKYITFGHYPQTSDGKDNTPIEWLILERDGLNALVVSKYGLDAQPYDISFNDVTWEKCTLRTWLNDTFYNKAFSADEQAAILTTNVDNSKNQCYSGWDTNGGNNTQDKVFLLSYKEAYVYFDVTEHNLSSKKSRVAPTAYAIAQGADVDSYCETMDGTDAGWWWLRSPGRDQDRAALVHAGGSLGRVSVNNDSSSVRPALWVNLESGIF